MTDFDATELPLPGLEPPARGVGENETAARRTIAALDPVLDERHSIVTQLLVTTARQLDRAASSPKSKDYGVANLVAQLRELFVLLVPVEGGDESADDPFDELARRLWRASPLRDTAES